MVQTTWRDDDERRVIEDVQRYGWHWIGIEDDSEGPAFAYSIGIWHTLKQPEIIIFGLSSMETMGNIINVIGEEMRKGTKFEDWHESDQILESHSCIFRRVPPEIYPEYLGFAMWFHRPDDFPVLQCVWPDREGRYPWHPEFPAELHRRQPILAQGQEWPFQEGKNRAVFTTRPVFEESHPILLVTHDADGAWQFLCGTTNRTEDARTVCLKHIVDNHPSVAEVAGLPVGWRAYRTAPDRPWQREQMGLDNSEDEDDTR